MSKNIMRKSSLLLGIAIPTMGCLTTGCIQTKKNEAKNVKPNVIIIMADDLGFGDVSAYGAKTISTPNIDYLAKQGVCFTNGYATSATSTPSRYALFTGMYPWKNDNAKILPGDAPLIIGTDQFTMPKMMKTVGYKTAAIGKWHLGMGMGNVNWNETVKPGAKEIGFDYSCLIAATCDRVPTVFLENGNVVGLEKDDPIEIDYNKNFEGEPTAIDHPEMLTMQWSHGHNNSIIHGIPRIGFMKGGKNACWVDENIADYLSDKVINYIDENKNEPFFLYYGLHEPHVPRVPNNRFVGKSGMGPRGDAILEADWCVGRVIEKLKKESLLDNTIVIFSSDNGPVLDDGYKDMAAEFLGKHKPSGNLRGGKYSLYEGGTRVPFFVYWKGHTKQAVSEALVSQLDIVSSIGALVGAKVPKGLDAENHIDALLGKSKVGRSKYILEANGKLAYHRGNYVLIPPYEGPEKNETGNELGNLKDYALFDCNSDAYESNNLFNSNKKLGEEMKAEFLKIAGKYYNPKTAEITLK